MDKVFPKAATLLRTHGKIGSLAIDVLHAKGSESLKETMFTSLADPTLTSEERTLTRLEDEGFLFLGAAIETTAYALSVTLLHLLDNPEILFQLYDELKTVIPEPSTRPPLSVLENLPLLVSAPVHHHPRLSQDCLKFIIL